MPGRSGSIPELVVAIASGQSVAAAASSAGMSLSTAQRRLREAEVLAAVQEARVDLTRQALGRVRAMREVALTRVAEVLEEDHGPAIALRAADLVLRHAAAADTAWLHERVLQLERQVSLAEGLDDQVQLGLDDVDE